MSVGFALRSPVCDAAIIAGVTTTQHRHLDYPVLWRYGIGTKGSESLGVSHSMEPVRGEFRGLGA
jgi:hypothetical protein